MRHSRFLILLCVINLVVFLFCVGSLEEHPGSGPEGIGTAMLLFLTLLVSALLAGFALNELYRGYQRKAFIRRPLLVFVFAFAPLALYVLFDVLHHWRLTHPN
jgi:hypothetical protein